MIRRAQLPGFLFVSLIIITLFNFPVFTLVKGEGIITFSVNLREPSYIDGIGKTTFSVQSSKREIDFAKGANVDVVRIDVYSELFTTLNPSLLDDMDDVVKYARDPPRNLGIHISAYGYAHAYTTRPGMGAYLHITPGQGVLGPQEWEAIESDLINKIIQRWNPDFISIAPEAPTLMASQINQILPASEWKAIIDRLSLTAKTSDQIEPAVRTVLGLASSMASTLDGPPQSKALLEELITSELPSLDIIGFNVYGKNSDEAMKWWLQGLPSLYCSLLRSNGYETWMTETGLCGIGGKVSSKNDYYEYRDYVTQSIDHAASNRYSGYNWFYFKGDEKGIVNVEGMVSNSWLTRPHYQTYREKCLAY